MLAYLSRYTHRVAISNRRLISADQTGVTFKWKDYWIEEPGRYRTMTLSSHEFIRRFLMHVLPGGFHRIRHYGLVASGSRAANIARARELLAVPLRCEQQDTSGATAADEPRMLPRPCPCCGGRMFIIETFARGSEPKHRPTPKGGNPKPFTKPKIAGIPISVSSAVARLRYSYWPLRRYFHMFASYKQSRGTVKLVSTCLRRIP